MTPSRRCDGCLVELLPDSLFCHSCGRSLGDSEGGQPGLSSQGERKYLSVLFVGAFGSIGLGERLDAEHWHDVIERFFSIVSDGVSRFGGTVDRLTGEGIKALFGAPAAQENHAVQACHAALHLVSELSGFGRSFRRAAGIEFSVRIGLNSGEVVYGRIGVGQERDFTSQGYAAAMAARMQQLAEPGQIYMTESTAALVDDFFELREVGSLPVRGASSGVRVYQLLRPTKHRSRFDVARDRGLSRFVGRIREMAELERAFARTFEYGVQVVGIVGEPGVGKSRLCDEFVELQRSRGLTVHHVRCVEHGRWIPFHASIPFFNTQFDLEPGDTAETKRRKVTARIQALDAGLESTLHVLFEMLGVAEEGSPGVLLGSGAAIRELAQVTRKLVEARDPRSPSLAVLDDQQWMDDGSEAVFAVLTAVPPQSPLLVLSTYRPGYQRPWMGEARFSEFALKPLGHAATVELAESLLGGDEALGDLAIRIAERAGGNPYFVEEIVLSLLESGALEGERGAYRLCRGVSEVTVPRTLQSVLAARFDLLGEDEKAVLQAGAVIGREFAVTLLPEVTGLDQHRVHTALGKLSTLEFISRGESPDGTTCLFRHPLMQETVYHSLLKDRRAHLHRAVARAGERLEQGIATAALLAHHHEAGGNELEAARWHARAGSGAARHNPLQAVEHWRRVFALTERLGADDGVAQLRLAACEAILRLGRHNRLGNEQASMLLAEGLRLAARLDDPRTMALLISTQGVLHGATGDVATAISHGRKALELASADDDVELMLLFGARLMLVLRLTGELDAALAVGDRVLDAQKSRDSEVLTPGFAARLQVELARAATALDRGDLAGGARQLDHLIEAARGDLEYVMLAWGLTSSAMLIRLSGEATPELVTRVEEAHSFAQHFGLPSMLVRSCASMSATRLCQARWSEARDLALESAERMRGLTNAFYADVNPAFLLAEAYLGLGDRSAALVAAREALAMARARGSLLGEIDAALALGTVLVRARDPACDTEAHSVLQSGLELALRAKARSREPHLRLELATLARRSGDVVTWRAHERHALRLLMAMRAIGHLRRSAALPL